MVDRHYRVAGDTHPNKLAGAIAKTLRCGESCELVACGAAAVNQAAKALAVARTYLILDQLTPDISICFVDQIFDDGRELTALAIEVYGRDVGRREAVA